MEMCSILPVPPRLSTLERQASMLHHLILVPEGVTARDARIAAAR